MFLPSDMLCLVQGFQQQPPPPVQEKEKRFRKLPFIRRKKSSSGEVEKDESLLLRPVSSQDSTCPLPCSDKRKLKQLSGSAPSMTCTPLDPPPSLTPTTCRSRQKKFLRHFNVDPEEKVIDYYSCALVADILLQGHLYISKNYFAFYSNVFGYVTKLLIPMTSVVNITKEKTAFILPNAVGVTTTEHRHVFSSLLSRDTTFRLMVQVWRNVNLIPAQIIDAQTVCDVEETLVRPLLLREESSSPSGSESVFEVKSANPQVPVVSQNQDSNTGSLAACETDTTLRLAALPRSTVLLAAATALLIALFLSASVLMYRLSMLHYHTDTRQSPPARALQDVHEYLDINLNHIYKVRQSLEVLSLLLETEREKGFKEDVLDHQSGAHQKRKTLLTQETDSRKHNKDLES